MKEIIIHAVQRSGSHAIINWLALQVEQEVRLVNDALTVNQAVPEYGLLGYKASPVSTPPEIQTLICGTEDLLIAEAKAGLEQHALTLGLHHTNPRQEVVIIRDPFNLFASRLAYPARGFQLSRTGDDVVACWKDHARAVLEGTMYGINYNHWCENLAYRQEVSAKFTDTFDDTGREMVYTQGGGSSFHGIEYNGRASEMPTSHRWKHYSKEWWFDVLFDSEVRELARELFGFEVLRNARVE